MLEDLVDIGIVEEHFGEALSQRRETIQRVLLYDDLGVVDQLVEVGETVAEAILDVVPV